MHSLLLTLTLTFAFEANWLRDVVPYLWEPAFSDLWLSPTFFFFFKYNRSTCLWHQKALLSDTGPEVRMGGEGPWQKHGQNPVRECFLLGGIPQIQGRREEGCLLSNACCGSCINWNIYWSGPDSRLSQQLGQSSWANLKNWGKAGVSRSRKYNCLYNFSSKSKVYNFFLNESTNKGIHRYSAAASAAPCRKTKNVFPQTFQSWVFLRIIYYNYCRKPLWFQENIWNKSLIFFLELKWCQNTILYFQDQTLRAIMSLMLIQCLILLC